MSTNSSKSIKKPYPSTWVQRMGVWFDPSDRVSNYPTAIGKVDPISFRSKPASHFEDNRVRKWGLTDDEVDPNDIMAFMKTIVGSSSSSLMYMDYQDPVSQFLAPTMKRKVDEVSLPMVLSLFVWN